MLRASAARPGKKEEHVPPHCRATDIPELRGRCGRAGAAARIGATGRRLCPDADLDHAETAHRRDPDQRGRVGARRSHDGARARNRSWDRRERPRRDRNARAVFRITGPVGPGFQAGAGPTHGLHGGGSRLGDYDASHGTDSRARARTARSPRHAAGSRLSCVRARAGRGHSTQKSRSFRTAAVTRSTEGMYASSICQYGYGTS